MFASRRVCLVVGLIFLVQCSAMAQRRGRRGPMRIDYAVALGVEQVRSELKITDDQAATIDAAIQAYQEEQQDSRPDRAQLSFLSPEEREDFLKEAAEDARKLSQKTDETLGVLLEPEQASRLNEMILQAKLQFAPVDALKEHLELSEEQLDQLAEVEEQIKEQQGKMRGEIMALMLAQGGRPDFKQVSKLFKKAQLAARDLALAVVTDEQKSTLAELQGEKFDLDLMQVMRRGGGRGRGRPGRGSDD